MQSISIPLLERHAELPDREEQLIAFRNGLRERLDRVAQEPAETAAPALAAPVASMLDDSPAPSVQQSSSESMFADFDDEGATEATDFADSGSDAEKSHSDDLDFGLDETDDDLRDD